MPSHTLCALTRLSPCIARFVFRRRRLDVCTVLDGGNTQPLSTLSGQDSLTRALKTSCHLELEIRWLPSPLLTSRNLWDSNPRGETPSAQQANALTARLKVSSARRSKSAAFQSRQSCDCQSLLLLPPSPRHLARSHRLMRTVCISRESNPGQMATMYSTTRPLMPLENLWT